MTAYYDPIKTLLNHVPGGKFPKYNPVEQQMRLYSVSTLAATMYLEKNRG